ncbi:MAG: DUF1573 domain-containing protein [candidate division Zixibacteria bacterium]|nr:DUF1573 domain-containing protein [candidate division Zixibacteria bacterium]
MKKVIVLISVFLITTSNAWADPSLIIPIDQHNFGMLPKNSILNHTFWLKSVGDDTVKIDAIKTGCSCAISKIERNWLAPGDSMAVKIEWDVSRYHSSIFRSIRVFYDSIKSPLRMNLKGSVVQKLDSARPISISPYRFEFASTAQKEIDSIQFTLTNRSSEDLNISNISGNPEQCKFVLPSTIPANSSVTGHIRLKPEYNKKEFQTSITLAVNNKQQTNFTIPIRRKIYR